MTTFPQTRGQALSLETQTETLLGKYSSFAQASSSSATSEELSLERKIDNVLHKREEVLGMLQRAADSDLSLAASKLQQLQRHKEVLSEHWKDFGRLRGSIQQERNRLNLLFSVRSDIENHRAKTSDEEAYLQDERNRVENANSFADRLLQQAYETREEFSRQRSVLSSAGLKVNSLVSRVPGINIVISKINTRRKRDALILACLISLCIVVLWLLS